MRASQAKGDSRSVILLVEDFRPLLLAMQSLLESSHYQVPTARTPIEALTVQEKFGAPIDLLLTRVLMPGMTGPELARRMRARVPHMAVLYMSDNHPGWLDRSDESAVLTSLLPDPFSSEVLLDRIRGILNENTKGTAGGGGSSPGASSPKKD